MRSFMVSSGEAGLLTVNSLSPHDVSTEVNWVLYM